jgi:hypothetical protein
MKRLDTLKIYDNFILAGFTKEQSSALARALNNLFIDIINEKGLEVSSLHEKYINDLERVLENIGD